MPRKRSRVLWMDFLANVGLHRSGVQLRIPVMYEMLGG